MKRREFIFRSMQSALLFSPVFNLRRVEAQSIPPRLIPFFFVDGGSPYPEGSDFFPQAGNLNASRLTPILQPFQNLAEDMVILDGIKIRREGPNIKGNWHVSSVGKILTAKAVHQIPGTLDGEPGGASIDHLIAQHLGVQGTHVLVNNGSYNHMRARPFARGNKQFNLPTLNAAQVFDNLFKNCQPTEVQDDKNKQERVNRLLAQKSILDSLVDDIKRLRREMAGVEKIKLDSHESAIREAEKSVAAEIKRENEAQGGGGTKTIECPSFKNYGSSVPEKSQTHFDVLYAAIKTQRLGVGGMMHGYSSTKWNYNWLNLNVNNNEHDGIFHRASRERDNFIKVAQWKWGELAKFADRLKNEPGGSLLDQVLIYATAHFGKHHQVTRIPTILIGNAHGKLQTGRTIKVDSYNDKSLTSMAHLCGLNIKGIGDDPNCGPLPELT